MGYQEPRSAAPQLTFTRFADIPQHPRKDWLVRGMLGEGEMTVAFGPPGCGKSALAGDLAAHIACGRPWFGREVSSGGVLYIAAERAALVHRRLRAFSLHHQVADMPLAVISGALDLRTNRTQAREILSYAYTLREEAGSLRLIVVDTVSRALAGGDENGPKDMGALVGALGWLQEMTGAHILAVHHIPADGTQRLRGHGSLLGAADITLNIERASGGRTATIEKSNDLAEDVRLFFDLESVTISSDSETGEGTTAPVVVPMESGPSRSVKTAGRLSPAHKIALGALQEAVVEQGQQHIREDHIPDGVLVVSETVWRGFAYKRGLSEGGDEAQRKAFLRAKQVLLSNGYVAAWGDFVWLLREAA